MKSLLDWKEYKDAGMGDAYADIPKQGGNFAKAVAVCINSRQCETTGRGVMCPSYRVTGDPALTPGGRVRLLKKALNSDSPLTWLEDPEVEASMDLCLGCKGCKRECENSVDMAQIKLEYQAQKNLRQPLPLRNRLFAQLPRLLHHYPRILGGLTRLNNRLPGVPQVASWLLRIAPRTLPETSTDPLPLPEASGAQGEETRLKAVLWVDTYSRYYQPQIATAAQKVLEAGGCQVILLKADTSDKEPQRPLCCGRTFLAQGEVDAAREEAERTLKALLPWVEAGYPIVGLEPSCLLAIRDDYRALGLGEAADTVSRQAWLLEEFLAREIRKGQMQLRFREGQEQEKLLVHGHCHQKAVGAMKSMRKLLKQLPGDKAEILEASCCGMGGSFGYEAEHHDLSQAMAEEDLLPRLRQEQQAQVIANGFSCRQQIKSACSRPPRHLAEILAERLQSVPDSVEKT
ncbi:(Fe-S)-binding protein [Marinospirillum perlucidum]|uniref:(Fe-S)-binding protein n=1 Tax=Marinospirillum perlucidum TaxID=1982602 RepID=UPI000DF2FF5D|nr:(Fe-S)-binding protein [Marinospirillum perlucidum]